MTILQEIVEILVAGITQMGTGIASGLSQTAQALFIQSTGTGADATQTLSVFGQIIAIFGGIGLAVGLTTMAVKWVMSLGARN